MKRITFFDTAINVTTMDETVEWLEHNICKRQFTQQWQQELERAYQYFLNTFWMEDGYPRYYNNSLSPIDIHCSAQGILTCLKSQKLDKRSRMVVTKIVNYQKNKWYTNKTPYIRWSQAWMFLALSTLLADNEVAN